MSAGGDLHLRVLDDVLVPLRVRACYGQQQHLCSLEYEPDWTWNELLALSSGDYELNFLLLAQVRFQIARFHAGPWIETGSGIKKVPS